MSHSNIQGNEKADTNDHGGNSSSEDEQASGQQKTRRNSNANVQEHKKPRPVLDEVTIELAEAGSITIELQNQLGQHLRAVTIFSGNKTTLDMSSLTSGIYLLQIGLHNSTKKVFKIVKK